MTARGAVADAQSETMSPLSNPSGSHLYRARRLGSGDPDDAGPTFRDTDDRNADNGKTDDGPGLQLARRKLSILIIAALVAIVASGLWVADYRLTGRYLEETNDATVEADETIVAPRVAGYVQEVLVAENEDVRVGQPLVRIEANGYVTQLAQSEARMSTGLRRRAGRARPDRGTGSRDRSGECATRGRARARVA